MSICFIHGFLGASNDWDPVRRRFPQSIALDLPGHGSMPPLKRSHEQPFDSYALYIKEQLDALHIQRVHLVGYSMGGRIAAYFATRFQPLVASLTLISAHLGLHSDHERKKRALQDQQWADRLVETEGEFHHFLHQWYAQPLFSSLAPNPLLLSTLLEQRKVQQSNTILRQILLDLSLANQPPLDTALATSKLPLALVYGERDVTYKTLYKEISARNPHWHLQEIPAVGHACHVENPQLLSNALTLWFNSILYNFSSQHK